MFMHMLNSCRAPTIAEGTLKFFALTVKTQMDKTHFNFVWQNGALKLFLVTENDILY